MSRQTPLERYDLHRGRQALGAIWFLQHGSNHLYCTLFTHPHGWELKLRNDRIDVRRQICRTQEEVFDQADRWRRDALPNGHTQAA